MGLPPIEPPLLNSASPWCTTSSQLQELYDCPHTGAITTRTSLLHGFDHDDRIHQRTFFDVASLESAADTGLQDGSIGSQFTSSLNTLGYSPLPLRQYLSFLKPLRYTARSSTGLPKPVIISVTGTPDQVSQCYGLITSEQAVVGEQMPLCMEINLSCPNIPSKPPPAFSGPELLSYLTALQAHDGFDSGDRAVKVGIKTPPYTYHDQFATLMGALEEAAGTLPERVPPVDFITATNTLGSCLLLDDSGQPVLRGSSGSGIGGVAGAAIHPLSLGNVRTIRTMLDASPRLKGVDVIGVGGVGDEASFTRMMSAGATVVAVGTALGRHGVGVFGKILEGQ